MKAIGLLETKGLIGNIEGLDAMMKAAQVDYVTVCGVDIPVAQE